MAHTLPSTVTASLLLALALPAQGAKKPDPKKEQPKKAAEPERPKDDALTAKDPAIVAIDKFTKDKAPSKKRADWRSASSLPPQLAFTKGRDYLWHLKTNKGLVVVKLLPDSAPLHVSSTIYLTRLGFYDGLTFHRVIAEFMAQGGCPTGDGSGSPGYKYDSEIDKSRKHDKPGIVSMANADAPNTDGCQFFITFAPAAHLDGKHTIFGEVVTGMDAVKALEAAAGPDQKPKEKLTIELSWITVVAATPAKDDKPGKDEKGGKDEKPGKN